MKIHPAAQQNPAYRHGHCRKSGQSSEYMIWASMRQRCYNPKSSAFKDYGQRGITVCERWNLFENFIEDMGPRPQGMTLERKDNSQGYNPDNCKWATRAENNGNKRNNIWLESNGVTMIASEWAALAAVSYRTFLKRINRGWDVQKALLLPSQSK